MMVILNVGISMEDSCAVGTSTSIHGLAKMLIGVGNDGCCKL